MKFAFAHVAVFIALSSSMGSSAQAGSRILDACPKYRKTSQVTSLDQLKESVQDIAKDHRGIPEAEAAFGKFFEAASALETKRLSSLWESDTHIQRALSTIASTLDKIHAHDVIRPKSASPAAHSLRAFVSKWSDPGLRTESTSLETYFNEAVNVLRTLKSGQTVTGCFTSRSPLISGHQLKNLKDAKLTYALGGFGLEEDPNLEKRFKKTLYLNPTMGPIEFLTIISHELTHACAAETIAQFMLEHKQASPSTIQEVKRRYNIDKAIDEIRAYTFQIEVHQEIAEIAPEILCNHYSVKKLFGTQIMTSAEFSGKVENIIDEGRFPQFIVAEYIRIGGLTPAGITKGVDYFQRTSLTDEFLDEVKKAGFKVKR